MYIPSETMWSQNKGLVELDVRRVGPYPIHVGIMGLNVLLPFGAYVTLNGRVFLTRAVP